MDPIEIYKELSKDFDTKEAYVVDKSRGHPLVGVRAAFVIERLNEVFGPVGYGWRFHTFTYRSEVYPKEWLANVVIQYRIGDGGSPPYFASGDGVPIPGNGPSVWSEPIPASGGGTGVSGGRKESDARKAAESDAISKAASKMGVAIAAYKGLVAPGDIDSIAPDTANEYTAYDAFTDVFAISPSTLDETYNNGQPQSRDALNSFRNNVLLPRLRKAASQMAGGSSLVEFVQQAMGKLHPNSKSSSWSFSSISYVGKAVSSIAAGNISRDTALDMVSEWDRVSEWEVASE